jgi:hypothetical protein
MNEKKATAIMHVDYRSVLERKKERKNKEQVYNF